MRDAKLTRLFVRFRDRRDGRALAAVFDATARELLGVAAHLVRDAGEAEDLVQNTFRVAIERAASFEPDASLKAWLYGILWREAAALRRGAARRADACARSTDGATGETRREPLDELIDGELSTLLGDALARIPSRYREVLEPLLRDSVSPREIARALGRAPGTVRVQIQRGLEQLRRALPPGWRSAPALAMLPTRGLQTVRAEVLSHAGLPVGTATTSGWVVALHAALAGTSPVTVWGVFGIVIAGLVVARPTFLAQSAHLAGEARGGGIARTVNPRTAHVAREQEPSAGAQAPARRAVPPPTRRPEHPQVSGIVVDEADTPLADIAVLARASETSPFVLCGTDADGRFALDGLAPGWWWFSVNDPRYADMWWRTHGVRIEELAAEAATLRIRLRAPRTVEGTVVDERGTPVPDVRVTLAVEWISGEEQPVQGHLTNAVQVVTTGAEGRFRMERLAPGQMTVVLDHADHARTIAQFDSEQRSCQLTIRDGLALTGRVVRAGEPLAGVTVEASAPARGQLSMGRFRTVTGDDGSFRFEHLASFHDVVQHGIQTVQVALDDPRWTSSDYAVFEAVEGVLPAVSIDALAPGSEPRSARIEVGRDRAREAAARGEPFGSAMVIVFVAPDVSLPADFSTTLLLSRDAPGERLFHRQERVQGHARVRFEGLAAGRYRVKALGSVLPNLVPREFELADGEQLECALRPGLYALHGKVQCAGRPVCEGWIWADSVGPTSNGMSLRARGSLEPDGTYAITGLVPGRYEVRFQAPDGLTASENEVLIGDEPGYLDLELPAGRIEGRLVGFELPPNDVDKIGRVRVFPRGWGPISGNRGVFVEPDVDGRFAVRHLPAGEYSVAVSGTSEPVPWQLVSISQQRPVASVELAPCRGSGSIAGELVGLPGTEDHFATTFVAAIPRDEHGYAFGVGDHASPDAKTGRFECRGLPPGTYGVLAVPVKHAASIVWIPSVTVLPEQTTALTIELPPGRDVRIQLSPGQRPSSIAIWSLRMPSGDWLPYTSLIGSEPEGRRAGPGPVHLPFGEYAVRAEFGDPEPVLRSFTLEPGEGAYELELARP